MKRIALLIALGCFLLLILGKPADGQEVGIKAGISHSRAGFSEEIPWITFKSLQEFSIGLYLSLDLFTDRLGLQPELIYTIKGFDAREIDEAEEISSKYKVCYLEFPVLFFYKVPLGRNIESRLFFGPYLGLPQKVTEVQRVFGNTEKRDVGSNFKNQDAGLVFGGCVRFPLRSLRVTLDARYTLGMTNISRDITQVAYEFREGDTITNRALALTVGIGFNLR